MRTPRERQRALRRLMREFKLSSTKVGALVGRTPAYVRQWKCGMKEIPEHSLRLLELELERRADAVAFSAIETTQQQP